MELFHGSKSLEKPHAVLTHFGSMLAASQRVESIFATREMRAYDGRDIMAVLDFYGRIKRIETLDEVMKSFANYAQKTIISKFNIPVSNPLHLHDCWDDDPIGSGGMEIFNGNDQITAQQRKELEKLFSPFSGVVFPQHVHMGLAPNDIRKILRDGQSNGIFKREYEKRRERSQSIGEDFTIAAAHEAVWVDLTLKLRNWAIANKFDAFVYASEHEADGAECCVTLHNGQVPDAAETYKFDAEKYLDMAAPVFKDYFKAQWEEGRRTSPGTSKSQDAYWCGFNPTIFWRPS